jgi:hypothetical protein
VVEERAANWIELYPECRPFSTFCIGDTDGEFSGTAAY